MLAVCALLTCLIGIAHAWVYDNHTCAVETPVLSCSNSSAIIDTCCVPTQGLVLITQFWDMYTGLEVNGSVLPKESWTIHGQWPDKCDGSYGQYCDLARQYDPYPSPNTTTGLENGTVVPPWKGGDIISPILERYGKYDLLAYIRRYWKSQGSPDWVFWQHEFSKHATCFSTFDVGNAGAPDCYGPLYANSTEASIIDFLDSTVRNQLYYPTYQWLADAGITPSNSTTYTLDQLQGVLANASGAQPYLGCSGKARDSLSEVWYYSHSLGRPQDAMLQAVDQTGKSSCNSTAGIYYYQRSEGSER